MPALRFPALSVAATLLLLFLGPAPAADPTSVASLGDLQGVWARSQADCQRDVASQWERGDIDRATATSYEMIGICPDGLELLFQPHHCTAASILVQPGGLEFRGPCRVKDYRLTARFKISVSPSRAIAFDKDDFDGGYFWIEGPYVRCTQSYACSQPLDP